MVRSIVAERVNRNRLTLLCPDALESSRNMKRKAAVTIETERLLVIQRSRGSVESWCALCAAQVDMVGVPEASTIAGASEREIFQLSEAGAIHFAETAQGRAIFCVPSLLNVGNKNVRTLARSTSKAC